MAKDHGSSVKNDKQYEGLRKKGMSKQRAASIADSSESSKKGGEKSGKGSGAASPRSALPGAREARSPASRVSRLSGVKTPESRRKGGIETRHGFESNQWGTTQFR